MVLVFLSWPLIIHTQSSSSLYLPLGLSHPSLWSSFISVWGLPSLFRQLFHLFPLSLYTSSLLFPFLITSRSLHCWVVSQEEEELRSFVVCIDGFIGIWILSYRWVDIRCMECRMNKFPYGVEEDLYSIHRWEQKHYFEFAHFLIISDSLVNQNVVTVRIPQDSNQVKIVKYGDILSGRSSPSWIQSIRRIFSPYGRRRRGRTHHYHSFTYETTIGCRHLQVCLFYVIEQSFDMYNN